MVDAVSGSVAIVAIGFAALTWWESRKQRALLETLTKSLPYVSRRRTRSKRKTGTSPSAPPTPSAGTAPHSVVPVSVGGLGQSPIMVTSVVVPPPTYAEIRRQRAEERRRLEFELKREKEQWRRQKDIAKAIGWVLDRIGSDDEEEDEDEE